LWRSSIADSRVTHACSVHFSSLGGPIIWVRRYIQQGRIYNQFVQLSGKSSTPQKLLINSFLLEVTADGDAMGGYVVAYSTVDRKSFDLKCKCVRKPDVPPAVPK
jgi:hypothetical protein